MDNLSKETHLGLHEDNNPEQSGYEYGKSIFDIEENTVCNININSDQNVNNKFEIDGIKYCLNVKDLGNFKSQGTSAHALDTNSLLSRYNLDPGNIKQLQQDGHITKIIDKCKSKKNDKTPYYLDEHGITYRKIGDGSNVFHANMICYSLQPYILHESHNAPGHIGSTRLYHFIRKHYYWKNIESKL